MKLTAKQLETIKAAFATLKQELEQATYEGAADERCYAVTSVEDELLNILKR